VLDLCAAPGGKTATLAKAAGPGAKIVAADRHAHRLAAIKTHFKRLRMRDVPVVELDGTATLPFRKRFARVLVDAPCSGTGTLGRNPEIRWTLRAEDLGELRTRQVALLRKGLAQLESGGRLVYSTCSLESEENESVIAEAIAGASEFRRLGSEQLLQSLGRHFIDRKAVTREEDAGLKPAATKSDATSFFEESGAFRASPPLHSTDGFFAVAIERE
jgi:16S rRNA (cytosine967-C5)-methyltransferase